MYGAILGDMIGSPYEFDKSPKTKEFDMFSKWIRVTCNTDAMRYWALQYGPSVEVIKPESLRNKIKEDIIGMYGKYGC